MCEGGTMLRATSLQWKPPKTGNESLFPGKTPWVIQCSFVPWLFFACCCFEEMVLGKKGKLTMCSALSTKKHTHSNKWPETCFCMFLCHFFTRKVVILVCIWQECQLEKICTSAPLWPISLSGTPWDPGTTVQRSLMPTICVILTWGWGDSFAKKNGVVHESIPKSHSTFARLTQCSSLRNGKYGRHTQTKPGRSTQTKPLQIFRPGIKTFLFTKPNITC